VNSTRLSERYSEHYNFIKSLKQNDVFPYFKTITRSSGTEVQVDGKDLIMISSNDYLGLSHNEQVIAKACDMIKRYGTGTGGSRFLCGNLELHEQLEAQLAEFVGKKYAIVLPTGFSTNLGAIASLLTGKDIILCDRENHASIFEACKLTQARFISFAHNDADHALEKLRKKGYPNDNGIVLLITEGVFSMSGSVVDLPSFIELKKQIPHLYIYLDDAHGIGTMGPAGLGVAAYYNVQDNVDFIMGTFSKSFGSIGGFVACNDPLIAQHLHDKSRTMIFSAALPAGNVATVLASLEIIKNEPHHLARLWRNIATVRKGYQDMGIKVNEIASPIMPIKIGDEDLAMLVSRDLFENNIFALPIIFPAVPRGKAVIRTSFMSTHSGEQLEYFLLTLGKVVKKYNISNLSYLEEEVLGRNDGHRI
jgi:8-amino-7-oxononanoate synthase